MIENEMHVTIVSYMSLAAEMVIMSCCFYRLAASFIENKKGALYSALSYFLCTLLLYFLPFSLPGSLIDDYFFVGGAAVLTAFFVMCRIEQRNYEHKIFLAVTFFSLGWLTFAMTEVLYDNLYYFATQTNYMQTHLDMWFALFVAVSIFYYLMRFAFMMIAVRCIVKAYARQSFEMSKRELLMLIIPSLAGIAGYITIWNYRVFYILGNGGLYAVCDVLVFLYCVVSVVTIVVVVVLYRSIRAKQEEKMQNELLDAQIESIRQHIEQVENLYRDIRSIRHDMANHLFTLEKLYEENETEEAKAYSAQLKETLTEMTGEIKSGNPVTDVILQEAKEKAKKRGISFHSAFYYPEDSKINAFDISVILHNALQNALENIDGSETAHIYIRSYQKKNAYIIEINNSCSKTLQWNVQTGLPATGKERTDVQGYGQSHGYGLSNIRKVAKKYYGDIDIALADGEFRLSVMLMI